MPQKWPLFTNTAQDWPTASSLLWSRETGPVTRSQVPKLLLTNRIRRQIMPKPLVFLAVGLFFGTGLGFLLAAGTTTGTGAPGPEDIVHDHAAHEHDGPSHSTLTETDSPHPTLTLTLHPDGAQSRNLHIGVTHFTFAPEAVNGPHVPGQGHAHVYVNNIKIARAYAPWMQLAALPVGTHEIRVTLNANDHSALATDGIPIEAATEVTIE